MKDTRTEFEKMFDARPGEDAPARVLSPVERAWEEVRAAHSASRELEVTLVGRSPRGWRVTYGALEGELWTDAEGQAGSRLSVRVLKYDMDRPVLVFFRAPKA